MKVLHYINFAIITIFLIAICCIEDDIVSKSLVRMQSECFEIERLVEEKDNIKNMDIVMEVENLEYTWLQDESNMCYLVNHKNIQEIGQEISKLKFYICENDVEAFKVSLSTIRGYCHSYLHFMGANFHNIL